MRTTVELLQLVTDNIENIFQEHVAINGICLAIVYMQKKKIISGKELTLLIIYLNYHLPERFGDGIYMNYCWIPEELEPRTSWLIKQINKEKEK